MISARVSVSYSALCLAVVVLPWNEMYVRPHYGLTCTYSNIHTNVESGYLTFFDLFIAIVISKTVRPAYEMRIVFFW
jgi:hypothetical protein